MSAWDRCIAPLRLVRCSGHNVPRIALIALAAALAAPGAAQAATLAPLEPCYRSVDEDTRENVRVEAAGFTPGATVQVAIDGVVVRDDVVALPDGTVSGGVSAPYRARGERPFALTVTERDKPANTVTATSRVTALAMRLQPREAAPSRKVRFLGRGFTDGERVYAHYLRAGKLAPHRLARGAQGARAARSAPGAGRSPSSTPGTGSGRCRSTTSPSTTGAPRACSVRWVINVQRTLPRGG